MKCLFLQEVTRDVLFSLGPQTLSPHKAIEVDHLFKMIFNNGFPRLWLCTAVGVAALNASAAWSSAPSLRFLYVPMKSVKDYDRLACTCPNLRWIPSSEIVSVDPINRKTSLFLLSIKKYLRSSYHNS
jgi:hypothetical protein